jgi:hypothetical protein
MKSISKFIYGSTEEIKDNIYKDLMMEIMRKKRNKLFTIYNILNSYSLSSKKKIEDIMVDKNDISIAIELLKNDENILYYYYCKNDKLYYLFEYTITPDMKNIRNNIDIPINELVDNYFSLNIDIDTIKRALIEPKKYINFNPKTINIHGNNLLKQLIILNEEKILSCIIDKYDIIITDNEIGCGIKYDELLIAALESNNVNIVNMINKCYYEKKCEKLNKIADVPIIDEDNEYKKNIKLIKLIGATIQILSFPILLYMATFKSYC